MDQVKNKTVELTDANNITVSNKMYYLVVKEGVGKNPSSVDSTFVTYKGTLLNRKIFDVREELPIWFDLTGVIRGFREFIPELRAGTHTVNPDGTYDFDLDDDGV